MEGIEDDLDRLMRDIEKKVGEVSDRLKTESGRLRKEIPRVVQETASRLSLLPQTVVSSVKLPQGDVQLIDALVDAGIFKNRDESISFFTHKGIEASRDWLAKVRQNLDEIKRLKTENKKL